AFGKALRVEEFRTDDAADFPPAHALKALVDLSLITGPLYLRPRSPGDVIQPFGMTALVKLKKYLHTHKPGNPAPSDLLLANHEEVLWIPGVGLSHKLRVRTLPTHKLSWLDLGSLPSGSTV